MQAGPEASVLLSLLQVVLRCPRTEATTAKSLSLWEVLPSQSLLRKSEGMRKRDDWVHRANPRRLLGCHGAVTGSQAPLLYHTAPPAVLPQRYQEETSNR